MNDFLIFFDDLCRRFPLHLVITYNKTFDWTIRIYKKGMAREYPNTKNDGCDVIIFHESDPDMHLCFAKAHVALKEWLLEFNGGY